MNHEQWDSADTKEENLKKSKTPNKTKMIKYKLSTDGKMNT